MSQVEVHRIMEICRKLSLAILENGGETYRAEAVILYTCRAFGAQEVNTIALPTGILMSAKWNEEEFIGSIQRVKKRGINLSKIDQANEISHQISAGKVTLDQAEQLVAEMMLDQPKHRALTALAAAASVACFAVLFHGSWVDVLLAGVCGFLIQFVASLFKREDMFHFMISLIGGGICSLVAVTFRGIWGIGNIETIISSSIMTLLPGLAMVNAIRDTMRGDLVSGVARAGEVLIISLSIAAGVGAVLGVFAGMGGAV